MKLYDDIMRDALLDAAADEFADILEDDNLPDVEFSSRYQADKRRFLRSVSKRNSGFKKVLMQAAVFVVVLLVLFSSSQLSMTASAQSVQGMSKGFKDTLVYTCETDYTPTADTGHWSAEYLPEGFIETTRDEAPDFCSVHYVYGTKLIDLIYFHTSAYMNIRMNTGSSFLEPAEVNGEGAIFHRAEKDGMNNVLMWFSSDGELVFMLDAALPFDEMIKIAENVKLH